MFFHFSNWHCFSNSVSIILVTFCAAKDFFCEYFHNFAIFFFQESAVMVDCWNCHDEPVWRNQLSCFLVSGTPQKERVKRETKKIASDMFCKWQGCFWQCECGFSPQKTGFYIHQCDMAKKTFQQEETSDICFDFVNFARVWVQGHSDLMLQKQAPKTER